MTDPTVSSDAADPRTPAQQPTLVEDLLLTMFLPGEGLFAGETTLYYVLAGAVVTELAMRGDLEPRPGDLITRVAARGDTPPDDALLRTGWEYVRDKPRNVQTVLAAIGPELRQRVVDRLVVAGHLREVEHRALGFIRTTKLELGDTGRRAQLLDALRATLVDGTEPDARTASIGALLSASGTLSWFHKEVPWRSPVIERAKQLELGDWGAGAAAEAVTRTMLAVVANSIVVAIAVAPRT